MSIDALSVILSIITVIELLFFVGILSWLRNENSIEKNSTHKVEGTVIGYAYGTPGNPPRVEYEVDGEIYQQILRYTSVTTYSTPFGPTKAYSPSDLLNTNITIHQNSFLSQTNMLEEAFPVGSQMTVWYNPHKPHNSFVERYASNKTIIIINLVFFVIGIMITVAGLVVSIIL